MKNCKVDPEDRLDKNDDAEITWDPLVFGPEFAWMVMRNEMCPVQRTLTIDKSPGIVCFSLKFSSLAANHVGDRVEIEVAWAYGEFFTIDRERASTVSLGEITTWKSQQIEG